MNVKMISLGFLFGILTPMCDNGLTIGYQPHITSRSELIGTWWGSSWDGYHVESFDSSGRYVRKIYTIRIDRSELVKERDTGTWSFIDGSFDVEIIRNSCWFNENLAGFDTPFVKGDCFHQRDTVEFILFDNWWLRNEWKQEKWRKIGGEQ